MRSYPLVMVLSAVLFMFGCRRPDREPPAPGAAVPAPEVPTQLSPDLPDGVPDTSGWPSVSGQVTVEAPNVASASRSGALDALLFIRDGICPDSDEPCSVTYTYLSSMQDEPLTGGRFWVVRWVISSAHGRGEGVGVALWTAANTDGHYSYWHRAGDGWVERQPGTPEYELEHQFTGALIRTIHARQQGQPQ